MTLHGKSSAAAAAANNPIDEFEDLNIKSNKDED